MEVLGYYEEAKRKAKLAKNNLLQGEVITG